VIRNSKPLESELGGGLCHGGESILPVAGQSVIVEASADLVARQKIGQFAFFGRSDLSAVFTELGGNIGETQRFVEILLVFEF